MSQRFLFDGAPEQPGVRSEPSPAAQHAPPHDAILRDSVQHIESWDIPRTGVSSYIPTARNMFAMLEAMCSRAWEQTQTPSRRFHNSGPGFFTPVLYLYYSHVVYFHILRARASALGPALPRAEEELLDQYKNIAPAERWPVAAPLIGFIQAMGANKLDDSYYSEPSVVPSLPDFGHLQESSGLVGLEKIPGMLRLPIIPALQKLVHNFGTGDADFKDDGAMHPVALPLSENHQFIGISSSGADSQSFLAVTSNLCWHAPYDYDDVYGSIDISDIRRRVSRWNVPDVPNNATLNTAESFLGLASNLDWMKHLLNTATSINRFFPNSTTLSEIPPSTSLGSLTHVEYFCAPRTPLTAQEDTWYYDRAHFTLKFKGFLKQKDGRLDTKLGVATSTNAEFTGYFPECSAGASPNRKGAFFEDDDEAQENREATFLSEGFSELDPVNRYIDLISRPEYFDSTGSSTVN
ncbi:hypothetical protein KVR01_002400 [Diaporthe batatas]|uniref:uncharacterized protein n=1 Tax=Diaporthe batatas TaxID=748121 RepID=UPI001D053849|nr:uncharacterized protein KVR01_002400 [Diaporthe batatas]KAG8166711.1 hypothetical protein KVR01_002400 [Diaporthe batatas]